jgi:hypothetical protein
MQRTCDGADCYLIGPDGGPCACGLTFDDVERLVVWPHRRILSAIEREELLRHVAADLGWPPRDPHDRFNWHIHHYEL